MQILYRRVCLAALAAVFFFASEVVAQVPIGVVQQGRLLTQEGVPVTDAVEVEFLVYNSDAAGELIWSGVQQIQPDETGFYYTTIGDDPANPIDTSVLVDGSAFLTIAVDGGEEMAPRQKLHAVPYATIAGNVTDGAITASKLAPGFSLNASQVPNPDWSNVMNVPADLADGDSDTLAAISCQAGDVAGYDGTNWSCVQVLPPNTSTLEGLSCNSGQSPIFQSGTWRCTTFTFVDTDTTYTAGANLTLTGTRFDVQDGPGSGLDADLLDGQQSSAFLQKSGGDMTGDLRTVMTRVYQSNLGVLTNQTALRSQSRLEVVNARRRETVAIPHAQFMDLCGDSDGCTYTIGMRYWNSGSQSAMAARGPYRMTYSPNGRWRVSNIDSEGTDGDNVETHAHNIYDCCYLTERQYISGVEQNDGSRQMYLLNWASTSCPLAASPGLECTIVFDD